MRRFVSFLLVLAVLVFACSPPPAHATGVATTVAIVGSLAMSLPVISQLATMALDAANMTPALRVAAADADTPMQAFVQRTFTDFLKKNALAVGTALRIASIGARYYEDGSISFDSNLSDLFGGYLDWLWDEEGGNLQASNPTIGSADGFDEIDTSGVDRQRMYHPAYTYNIFAYRGNSYRVKDGYTITATTDVYFVIQETGSGSREWNLALVSDQPFRYSGPYDSNNSAWRYGGSSYYQGRPTLAFVDKPAGASWTTVYNGNGALIANAINDDYISDIAYLIYNGSAIGGDVVTDPGILTLPENKDINILKPQDKMEGSPDFGPLFDAGATVAVADYLQSVVDGIETGDFSLPTTDASTGESAGTIEGEMSQTQAMERAQALTSDLTATGTGVVTDTAPAELGPYTLDLTAYFPFCIPFDLMYIFSMLQAAPEAPRIEYPFLVPGIIDTTIVIDLSPYDTVASTLRTMELIAFAVALAFATKRLIQGGD